MLVQTFCRRMLPPFLGSHNFISAWNKLSYLPNHEAFCFKRSYSSYASGWRVRYSNSIKGNISVSSPRRPDRLWGPTSPFLNWCRGSFPEVKRPGSVVYLKPKWRVSGALPLLPLMPSRYGQTQCCLSPYLRTFSNCKLRNRVNFWRGAF